MKQRTEKISKNGEEKLYHNKSPTKTGSPHWRREKEAKIEAQPEQGKSHQRMEGRVKPA